MLYRNFIKITFKYYNEKILFWMFIIEVNQLNCFYEWGLIAINMIKMRNIQNIWNIKKKLFYFKGEND